MREFLNKLATLSKSYIILPVHNKAGLIEYVLEGIKKSFSRPYKLFVIFDGCTDSSEEEARNYVSLNKMQEVVFSHLPDVHEVTSINYGLLQTRLSNPNDDDYVFTIQDDVILQEENIESHFDILYNNVANAGYISMRLGSTLTFDGENVGEKDLVESEFGHWKQVNFGNYTVAERYSFHPKQIAIRSPTCVKWNRYKTVGFYDATFAPCGYDCHDFSLRMNQHGYQNGVFALKFRSDVGWGGMRSPEPTTYSKLIGEVYEQNRKYLVSKHKDFFRGI